MDNLKRKRIKKLISRISTPYSNYKWVNTWDNYHYNLEKGKKQTKGVLNPKYNYCIYEEYKTEICSMCQGCMYDETLGKKEKAEIKKRWGF